MLEEEARLKLEAEEKAKAEEAARAAEAAAKQTETLAIPDFTPDPVQPLLPAPTLPEMDLNLNP